MSYELEQRCEAVARIGVPGVESHRCRRLAVRVVRAGGRRRHVCHTHRTAAVFFDDDGIGEEQRERARRVAGE